MAVCLSAAAVLTMEAAQADVPANYKGTPYLGTARSIPGRIEFEHYDMGGPGVGWKHDNKAGAAGSNACGRENDGEAQHPSCYTTNSNPGEVDKLPDGKLYPSEEAPKSTYIGASHATDWMNVTVNAEKAGEYWLSSHFATEGNSVKIHVSFNGVNKTGNLTLTSPGGYHNWKSHRNFAKVQLEAGLQVMQFTLDQAHTNWDYLYLATDSASVPTNLRPRNAAERGVITAMRPVRGSGALSFGLNLPQAGPAHIRILDSRGRLMAPVFSQTLQAGSNRVSVPVGASSVLPLFAEVVAGGVKSTAKIQQLP
jgi:hypothetical protein